MVKDEDGVGVREYVFNKKSQLKKHMMLYHG
jgi:hypothetical protein